MERQTATGQEVCDTILSMKGSSSVSQLLVAWGRGEPAALEELAPKVYTELHKIARAYLRRGNSDRTLQPTALINEAFVRLLDQPVRWTDRAHFFGIAARTMRHVLVDQARAHAAAKRGGARPPVTLDNWMAFSPEPAPNVLEVDQALRRLAEVDERKARVIEMRYFGGMDREEVATALGLTVHTVKKDLRLGEAWLRLFLSGDKC